MVASPVISFRVTSAELEFIQRNNAENKHAQVREDLKLLKLILDWAKDPKTKHMSLANALDLIQSTL